MIMKQIKGVHFLGNIPNMHQMFGPNGQTMIPVGKYKLDRGVKVISYGAGMTEMQYVIIDDEMNAIALDPYCNADWDREPSVENDRYLLDGWHSHRIKVGQDIRPLSAKFGIGHYFDGSGVLIDDETIAAAERYCCFLDKLVEAVEEADKLADLKDKERCRTQYPHLQQVNDMNDYKLRQRIAGNNIRAELKKHFPNTKFSVKYNSFSGGNSYHITWTDGAKYEDVDSIVRKFQENQPDKLTQGDYWDYCPTNFTKMYGGASYIICNRSISEQTMEKAKAMLLESVPDLTDENVNKVQLPFRSYHYLQTVEQAAYCYASEFDWQEIKEKTSVEQPLQTGKYQMIEYSERAVAIIGDTKAIKDKLKELGGRFNSRLSCGAGWIFSKSKEEQLKQLIESYEQQS